ncbi:hypothetical protein [Rhizobium sp. NXC24]|uniref:hypothetical protein n=1 Tax=Rhizobium sp. NXC24 TaxID=2048897 RepID=UPI000CDF4214|nr:hypothetical protein [Rhizobium sp. NXC24]AVA21348.1 hypothetical protein NXC24_CH01697 [Rhizobium sp. NXC24]
MNDEALSVALAREMLRDLPQSLIEVFQDDPEFCSGFDQFLSRTVTFGPAWSFDRLVFFEELANLYLKDKDREIVSNQGGHAVLSLLDPDSTRQPVLLIEDRTIRLPDTWYVSPIEADRRRGIRKDVPVADTGDIKLNAWLDTLRSNHLDRQQAVAFEAELALVPKVVSDHILSNLYSKNVPLRFLVPGAARYFERLVGRLSTEETIGDYILKGASTLVRQLVETDHLAGAKWALLLSAHPHFHKAFEGLHFSTEHLQAVFEWAAASGDLISQLGAFEWGMALLGEHPEIESKLFNIATTLASEDAASKNGRFQELSNLFCFVDGSVSHTGFMRHKPAFWRRLGTIAQASLIQRLRIYAEVPSTRFCEQFSHNVTPFFSLQTLVDLRTEPRWIGEFASAEQLKAEFMGRLLAAAKTNESAIQSDAFRTFAFSEQRDSLVTLLPLLIAHLPGPIEGAVDALIEPPSDLVDQLYDELDKAPTSKNAFNPLVNISLVFKTPPDLSARAAKAIRDAKYLVQAGDDVDTVPSLLFGLAFVAATTRGVELAQEVLVLARVLRHRSIKRVSLDRYIRIGLIAAAAHSEEAAWRQAVGDWLTELSYEARDEADIQSVAIHVQVLLHIEPRLWSTCSRAAAALSTC